MKRCLLFLWAGSLLAGCNSNTNIAKNVLQSTSNILFGDVPSTSGFYPSIATIYTLKITSGCGTASNGFPNFCPDNPIPRQQFAVLLLKSRLGPNYAPPAATGTMFSDVPASNSFAPWIEAAAAKGYMPGGTTEGFPAGTFSPGASMTRAMSAQSLMKAKNGPTSSPPPFRTVFADVLSTDPAAPRIIEIYDEGVTAGCGNGNFCPASTITRAQAAVFLVKTFKLYMP